METSRSVRVTLSTSIPTILSLDGDVLECFFDEGGSRRIHVAHIKAVKLDPPGKDKRLLTIELKRDPVLLWTDEAAVPQLNVLLEQLRRVMENLHGEPGNK